ncbi:MAG TPA: M1 family metallopeptidase [Gemmatimonadaceae bacterium]|nr:M1 family metallopeptidase [Gemmatimonadaceae bacterium]
MKSIVLSFALLGLVEACAPVAAVHVSPVQGSKIAWPERAVRRDVPLGPQIRRAYARGTRDSTGAPGARYFQQSVDYKIDATIDPASNQLRGSETITLHNTTPDTLKTIVVRLYQNYFTPTVGRTGYVTDITDGITIERLSVNGASIELKDRKAYRVDERVATVTPASPVMPGADVTIETAWHFTVPNVDTTARGERMGRFGNYLYQMAQWYPQIAMYDDMRGWDTDQYLGSGEFYNQYGKFDVRITAPGGWLLGATGDLQNPAEVYSQRTRDRLALAMRSDSTIHVVEASERGASATTPGSTLTWHFTAPRVNDFAFSVSRDYVLDATRANIPGKGFIPVYAFYLPQHTGYRTNNTVYGGARALEEHSRYVFPYEFSQGTIADGPETGMENPMIIFNSASISTAVHEFGHQWFPMMVGSNETRYAWMDEGLNDFIDVSAIANITKQPPNYQNRSPGYLGVAGSELEQPMMWPTDYGGPNSGVAGYSKAPIALYALGAVVGDSAVRKALSNYAVEWKYKHPSPWDFFMSMNRSLGKDLGWFWHEWFFTNYTFDQSIASVTTEGANAVITVYDKSDLVMPVIAKVVFADSTSETVTAPADVWFAGSRSTSVTVPLRGKAIKSVTLDPDNRFQDIDRTNNTWPAK